MPTLELISPRFAVKKAAEDKASGAGTGERRRSSVTTEKVKLNSGHYIPQVALGVYKAPNDGTTESAVKWAFEAGYRHVDSGEWPVGAHNRECKADMLNDAIPLQLLGT